MAEERNLATARATETTTEENTKAELQRRMEEARESITQTVSEIKDTVTTQYQSVKDSVTEALDWKEQYRKRPVAFSVGALSVGFVIGYGVAGAIKGDGTENNDYEEDDLEQPSSYNLAASTPRSHAPVSSAAGRSEYSSYGTGYPGTNEEQERDGPGLFERFKGTAAFERLESEVGKLGDRFVDELSKTAQHVVLPALIGKVKELFGVDLSNKDQVHTTGSAIHQQEHRTTEASTGTPYARQDYRA